MNELARIVEALLFLSPEPVAVERLADACEVSEGEVVEALARLREHYAEGFRGVVLREVAGGFTLATDPVAERAARRLLAKPRTPPLTQAQAECLAIVAYLQPVSRPGDRPHPRRGLGVGGGHAARARADRGVGPLALRRGRSTAPPSCSRSSSASPASTRCPTRPRFDPTPEEEGELRERLLRAGEQRAPATPACLGVPELPASCATTEARWRRFPGRERLDGAGRRADLRRRPRPRRHPGRARRPRRGRRAGHLLPGRRAGRGPPATRRARWPSAATRSPCTATRHVEHDRARPTRAPTWPAAPALVEAATGVAAAPVPPALRALQRSLLRGLPSGGPGPVYWSAWGMRLGADPRRAHRRPGRARPRSRARSCCCTTRRATPTARAPWRRRRRCRESSPRRGSRAWSRGGWPRERGGRWTNCGWGGPAMRPVGRRCGGPLACWSDRARPADGCAVAGP